MIAAEPGTQDRNERGGFWRRIFAMVTKEVIQLARDRVSFAMIVMIPVMQILLFGYAINTTPRDLNGTNARSQIPSAACNGKSSAGTPSSLPMP